MTEVDKPESIPSEDQTSFVNEGAAGEDVHPPNRSMEEKEHPRIDAKDSTEPQISQVPPGRVKGDDESNSNPSQSRIGAILSQPIPSMTLEQQLQKAKRELQSMVLNYAKSERENLQNIHKVEELDKKLKRSIKDNEQLANRIKILTNDKNHLTDTLNAKMAQLTVLEQKNSFLVNVQGTKLKDSEEKMRQLESSNDELLKQIESFKNKEIELMDFSEKLSMKHMLLQSDLEDALKRVPDYKEQHDLAIRERDNAIRQSGELSERIDSLTESLRREQAISEALRNEIDDNELKYKRHLDELHNEIRVLRRKQQMATKELVKEIKHLQAQLDDSSLSKECSNDFVSPAQNVTNNK